MPPDESLVVDFLVLGGGCAGLSLAQRLAALGDACPKVLILEKRTDYTNDRTWCFWSDGGASLDHSITHEWRWLKLRSAEKTVLFDCGRNAYQMVAASDFYEQALQAVGDCSTMRLARGYTATGGVTRTPAGFTVSSSLGQITAKQVVDTRPMAQAAVGLATLWQSFYGHEIHCEAAVFTPHAAELMDFTAGVAGQIPFTYALPITAHRALVEATVFGPCPLAPAMLTSQLDSAVQRYTKGHTWSVLRSENGILPMGLTGGPGHQAAGHVTVGVMAGSARASSGFAFQRIQRWADECAAAIAAGLPPTGHRADPWLVQVMDALFLHVLRAAPQAAPGLFLSLFERTDSASLIRFMSGNSTLRDCLRVMKALPAGQFMRQLLSRFPAMRPHRAP